jgi:toxin ParE1/3/4
MINVRFLAEARKEFLIDVAYYEKARVGLGVKFRSAVNEAVSSAAEFPM